MSKMYVESVVLEMLAQAREQGYKQGFSDVQTIYQTYMQNIFIDLFTIDGIRREIRGAALAGFGETPIEQIKVYCGELMEAYTHLDFDVARAHESGYFDSLWDSFNLRPIQPLYEAAKAYYSGADPTGAQLKAVVENMTSSRPAMLAIRQQLKPGRSVDEGVTYIAIEARALAERKGLELNTVNHYQLIGQMLYSDLELRRHELTGGAVLAYEKLHGCIRPGRNKPDKKQLGIVVKNAVKNR